MPHLQRFTRYFLAQGSDSRADPLSSILYTNGFFLQLPQVLGCMLGVAATLWMAARHRELNSPC